MLLLGCDFSSRPTRRKPIVLALGHLHGSAVMLDSVVRLDSLESFAVWLSTSDAWIGGFDLPFGLPRELLVALGWPLEWESSIRHFQGLQRSEIRAQFKSFCASRPPGGKFAHRACDIPAGSSPSMKWVNPPVAYMLHAGVPLLLDVGVSIPGLKTTQDKRIALEAYPGLLARELLGARSYKSDDKAKQTPERLIARKDVLTALEAGRTRLALRIKLTHAQRELLVEDASGDSLDAALCMVQAAWAWAQKSAGHPLYGLPECLDPLEGWIVTA
ncbi:MAG: DUF429 domain-containing protein [Burkholderiales bacterium PBB4]|nr:MAG: DUF429 domain-containing protein [Burkholderiales bacterium PBB4]